MKYVEFRVYNFNTKLLFCTPSSQSGNTITEQRLLGNTAGEPAEDGRRTGAGENGHGVGFCPRSLPIRMHACSCLSAYGWVSCWMMQ